MNKLLSMVTLLADTKLGRWEQLWSDKGKTEWLWLGRILDFINDALPFILVAVATVGIIYAIILGVNMAKAEDASKREEAKKRIINFVIAIVVTIVLISVMYLVINQLPNWIEGSGDVLTETPKS